MKHQHTLTRGPRYAGKGDHEFYTNADNGPRISTYFLSDEDWQAMGCPDEVVLTVAPTEEPDENPAAAPAEYKIGLLVNAIRDIGVAAGVLREDIEGMSGPEALMFAADTADHVRKLAALATATEGGEDRG